MANTRDYNVPGIFADDATTTIPASPATGTSYRDDTIPVTEYTEGWPYNELVDSSHFNQIMYNYSSVLQEVDTQGLLGWTNQNDYGVSALVRGSDGEIYISTAVNGPGTGVIDPVGDVSGTWLNTGLTSGPGGGGTVTEVNTGAGLTGGPINASGTIAVDINGATAATLDGADEILFGDVSNSNAIRKATVNDVVGIVSSGLSISQGNLNTSTGSVSFTSSGSSDTLILPGGQYGFYPRIRGNAASNANGSRSTAQIIDETHPGGTGSDLAEATYITLSPSTTFSQNTVIASQRYINSSPPFDMGDGEVAAFLYLKFDKTTDELKSSYFSDVPPWAYNGPTKISADVIDENGKKWQWQKPAITPEQMFDPDFVPPEKQLVEVTHAIKNADMNLLPSPFLKFDPEEEYIVLIDPMCGCIEKLRDQQNAGEDIMDFLRWIRPSNEALTRGGPDGIMQVGYSIVNPNN